MLSKKEKLLISHLRENARKNLTRISRETGIPVSTIFERLKLYEKDIILKHTTILDFSRLGYNIKANIVIKVQREERDNLQSFLNKQESVNSLYRINNGYDFLVEAVFLDMKEANDFTEKLERFKIKNKECFYVLEDIKKEAFMGSPSIIKAISMNQV